MNVRRVYSLVNVRALGSIALLATGVLGCIPFPHLERESPPVSGVIEADGAPQAGTAVRLIVGDGYCSDFWRETRTDEQGRFEFPANRRFAPFLFFAMSHTLYAYSVCIDVEGRFVPAIRVQEYTLTGTPGAGPMYDIAITCELMEPPIAQQPSGCVSPRYASLEPVVGCSYQVSRAGS